MLRFAFVAFCAWMLVCRAANAAADVNLAQFDRADIAPTKTSIYVGSVSMTMPTLVRTAGVYEAAYSAKVFPYFFYNETGRLQIVMSDEALRQLSAGETIQFSGRAVRGDGAERRVEGRATPFNATRGKIKVRVFVSERVELIFNTTYHFPNAGRSASERQAAAGP